MFSLLYSLCFLHCLSVSSSGIHLAISRKLILAPDLSVLLTTLVLILMAGILAFLLAMSEYLLVYHTSSLTLSVSGVIKVSGWEACLLVTVTTGSPPLGDYHFDYQHVVCWGSQSWPVKGCRDDTVCDGSGHSFCDKGHQTTGYNITSHYITCTQVTTYTIHTCTDRQSALLLSLECEVVEERIIPPCDL